MNWCSTPSEERIRLWKIFRDELNGCTIETQLIKIAKFCSSMPFGSRTLDYFNSDNWPTPWEILFHGSFCTSSISLLMFYTLILVDNTMQIELLLVEDNDGQYLLPLINNRFILNYELGSINMYNEISENIAILKRYSKNQTKNIT